MTLLTNSTKSTHQPTCAHAAFTCLLHAVAHLMFAFVAFPLLRVRNSRCFAHVSCSFHSPCAHFIFLMCFCVLQYDPAQHDDSEDEQPAYGDDDGEEGEDDDDEEDDGEDGEEEEEDEEEDDGEERKESDKSKAYAASAASASASAAAAGGDSEVNKAAGAIDASLFLDDDLPDE